VRLCLELWEATYLDISENEAPSSFRLDRAPFGVVGLSLDAWKPNSKKLRKDRFGSVLR